MKPLRLVKPFFNATKKEIRAHPFRFGLFFLCIALLVAIELYDLYFPLTTHDWIETNIERIQVNRPDDFYFAVLGDNKNSHTVFEDLLKRIDRDRSIAFAIDIGDLVYDGEKQKYRYFVNQVQKNMSLPFLTAIGNHELREGGRNIYYDIFGPFYYSFQIGKSYFIVLDDANEKDLDLFQKQWLEKELANSQKYDARFVFMHVPLYDPRGGMYHHSLPEGSANKLIELFKKYHVTYIFASHIHGYFSGQWQKIPYTITGGAGGELVGTDPNHYFYHYLKVHVKDESVTVSVEKVRSPDYERLDRLASIAWLYSLAFLRFHGIELILIILAGGMLYIILKMK